MRIPSKHQDIKVLIAEDFTAFREFLRSKLEGNGFRTIMEAEDGLDAVEKAAELQPDLVLLDIAMPKLNGIEAAHRIRGVAPQSRIIFVSQINHPDVVHSALSNGAKGYLHKSEINQEVLSAIEAVLAGKHFISPALHSTLRSNRF